MGPAEKVLCARDKGSEKGQNITRYYESIYAYSTMILKYQFLTPDFKASYRDHTFLL